MWSPAIIPCPPCSRIYCKTSRLAREWSKRFPPRQPSSKKLCSPRLKPFITANMVSVTSLSTGRLTHFISFGGGSLAESKSPTTRSGFIPAFMAVS